MLIHVILSGDARHYLGLETAEVRPVSELPRDRHWYGTWRLDLWPDHLAGLSDGGEFAALMLTNEETSFSLLRVDSVITMDFFKKNLSSHLQWPLHLGSFPVEDYGSMKIRFYRGSHRSLAKAMKDRKTHAEQMMQSKSHTLEELQDELNDTRFQVNEHESPKEMMARKIREEPPKFFPLKLPNRPDDQALSQFKSGSHLNLSESVETEIAKRADFTERQGQFLAYIHSYTLVNGRAPAEADMCRFFKITAPSVHSMVVTLERRGLIKRVLGQPRSISLLVSLDDLPILQPA